MDVDIRRTNDTESSFGLAAALPDYFNAAGLDHMNAELASGDLYGAFTDTEFIGFAVYKELNPRAVELAWLAVRREHWSCGVGTSLVTDSLGQLPSWTCSHGR